MAFSRNRLVPWVLLSVALVLVVGLARRLTDVSGAYRQLQHRTTTLSAGAFVPTFRAAAVNGDSVTIGAVPEETGHQVLLILTTRCQYCRATLPLWAAMADSLQKIAPGVQVVAVSLDSIEVSRAYAQEHRLPYPLVILPEPKLARLLRTGLVPQTAVLDHGGRVLYGHTGVLDRSGVLDSVYRAVLRPRGATPGRVSPADAVQDRDGG